MCIVKENLFNKEIEVKQTNVNNDWTQLFRKPLRPKLSRRIVSSTKLNLNRYWHKFEELLAPGNTKKSFDDSTRYRLLPLISRKHKISMSGCRSNSTTILIDRNNVRDEIESFMSKNYSVEKNHARSSMYKHFNDESLYHGVNLNLPRQRCSCSILPTLLPSKYPFSHRNIQLSHEDKENLENEALEVYNNYDYDISF